MRLRSFRQVALVYDARCTYDMKVLMGVANYLQDRNHHSVLIQGNALGDRSLPDLGSSDGVIADFDDPAVARLVVESGLPAVAFGGGHCWGLEKSSIRYFRTDNKAIARLAADHLLDRGFRQFAYVGYPRTPTNGWAEERQREFVKHVGRRGFSCHVFRGRSAFHKHDKTTPEPEATQNSLGLWLGKLRKPVGVMAANDNRGLHVLEACRAYSLSVPDDVAVIGVDNDELLCKLSTPPLSSVEQGTLKLGYAAAALLDKMMEGRQPRQRRFVIDPIGVLSRRSTDALAVDDASVRKAMAFIRKHACGGIKVPQVVAATSISRSGLETRFASVLGCTIHAAIRRNQVEAARELIAMTGMPLKQVAFETGFSSVQHMTSVFAEVIGETPARYRRIDEHVEPWVFGSDRRRK